MQALKASFRYLALLAFTVHAAGLGCGGDDSAKAGSTADGGGTDDSPAGPAGGDNATSAGTGASTTASGGDTAIGASADGGVGTSSSGGGSSARGGNDTTGGSARGGTSSGGTSSGGTSIAGAGGSSAGGITGARSCERDCVALASTACAGADFTKEKCVTDCQKAFQDAAEEAESVGCLDEFLALDTCRADDPVCTHPNPRECVPENDAYIQCLQSSI